MGFGKRGTRILGAILAGLFVCGVALALEKATKEDLKTYEKAVSLYKQRKYEQSLLLFKQIEMKDLGTWRNYKRKRIIARLKKELAKQGKQQTGAVLTKKKSKKELIADYNRAVKLYKAKKYEEAKPIFQELRKENLGFWKNRSVRRYLAAIEKMEKKRPSQPPVKVLKPAPIAKADKEKLDKAVSLYKQGKYNESKQLLQELHGKPLADEYAKEVATYLALIKAKEEKAKEETTKRARAVATANKEQKTQEKKQGQVKSPTTTETAKEGSKPKTTVPATKTAAKGSETKKPTPTTQTVKQQKAEAKAKASTPQEEQILSEAQRRALEILMKERRFAKLAQQRNQILAEHHITVGRNYMKKFEYEKARKEFRKALDLNPKSQEALLLLEKCNAMLDIRKDRIPEIARRVSEMRHAEVEKALLQMKKLYEEGKQLLKEKQYDDAIRKFKEVREIIHWLPYKVDVSEYDRGTKELISQATEEKKRWEEELEKIKLEEGMKKLAEEVKEEKIHRKKRIKMLMRQAREYEKLEKYDKARDLYDEILSLQPDNYMAAIRKASAQRKWLMKRGEQVEEQKELKQKELFLQGDELSIPQSEIVKYPDDWEIIKKRRAPTFGKAKEAPEWKKAIEQQLDTRRISFFFQGTKLSKVLDYLQEMTGMTYIPKLEGGVDPPVNLRVNQMLLRNALDWIATVTNTKWVVMREAIYFGKGVQEESELRFYPIRDLLFRVVDYQGPTVQITTDQTQQQIEQPQQPGAQENIISPDLIIQYIKAIEPDSWNPPNGIQYHGGMLLVINSPRVHEKIEELLTHFRSTRGLEVAISSQFLEVSDNFLEDLGVELKGLGATVPGAAVTGGTDAGVVGPRGKKTDWRLRIAHSPDVSVSKEFTNSGGLGLAVSLLSDIQARMILHAVRKEGKGDILTAPKLTCFDGQRAYVLVADQVAYVAGYDVQAVGGGAGGAVAATPQVRRLLDGVVLDVRPIVSADRKYITMDVHPGMSTVKQFSQMDVAVGSQGSTVPLQLPLVATKIVHTTVMIPDGGTILIGGLMNRVQRKHNISVPFLAKIPVLNNLFRQKAAAVERRNLIILMRGKVVDLTEGKGA